MFNTRLRNSDYVSYIIKFALTLSPYMSAVVPDALKAANLRYRIRQTVSTLQISKV